MGKVSTVAMGTYSTKTRVVVRLYNRCRWNHTIGMIFILMVAASLGVFPSSVAAAKLNKIKGDHFVVHHSLPKDDAQVILRYAEKYYDTVVKRLGINRYGNFWTWDNRCQLYVYGSRDEYLSVTRQAPWACGHSELTTRTIHAYAQNDFVVSVLPHEITHLIFADFTTVSLHVHAWLHEGVAMSSEEHQVPFLRYLAQKAFTAGTNIPLAELLAVKDLSAYSDETFIQLFYAESLVVVEYLLSQHFTDRFMKFCADIRDGESLERAIEKNYRTRGFSTIAELEEKVREYVFKNA